MKLTPIVLATIAAFGVMNANANNLRTLITPTCLIQKSGITTQPLAMKAGYQLIQLDEANIEKLALAKHVSNCGGFKDVSADFNAAKPAASFLTQSLQAKTLKDAAYSIRYPQQTAALISQLQPETLWNNLSILSSFKDRYSNSNYGVQAAAWIKAQVDGIAAQTGHTTDYTSYYVQTGNNYKQPSLVVKLGTGTGPGIVIGGHMDTLSSKSENKPGADDDGSGSVTVLETARTVLSSGMRFNKPIYFIWYSAEEMGLVGSSYVVKDFKQKKIPVDAVLQIDMTGYENQNDPTMWLITDHVNTGLTNFIETLIKTYVGQTVKRSACGYACSDHASWDDAGFKSAFPFEAKMNSDDPDAHTAQDTMDKLSLDHMKDYLKLAASFAVEMGEPQA